MKRLSSALVVALCLGWTMLLASPAHAHAAYKTSDPADGATVSSAPSSVWAEFTEPPGAGSTLEIYDACGDRVDNGNVVYDGYRMSIGMSSGRAGTFTAAWYAVSTLDGHPTRGSFTFTASSGSPCPGSEAAPKEEDREKDPAPADPESSDQTGTTSTDNTTTDEGANVTAEKSKEKRHHDRKKDEPRRKDKGRSGTRLGDTKVLGDRQTRSSGASDQTPVLLITFGVAAALGVLGGRAYAGLEDRS